jgi:hypothetical protein
MAERKPENLGEQLATLDKAQLRSIADALDLPNFKKGLERIGQLVECLVEGAKAPAPMERPPAGFRMRAWQTIDRDRKKGELHLVVDDPGGPHQQVEVAFEDYDQAVNPKKLQAGENTFDLPELWAKQPGPRFVTVYLRERALPPIMEPKTAREEPTTIIRIIPAPIRENAADEFGEVEAAVVTDD